MRETRDRHAEPEVRKFRGLVVDLGLFALTVLLDIKFAAPAWEDGTAVAVWLSDPAGRQHRRVQPKPTLARHQENLGSNRDSLGIAAPASPLQTPAVNSPSARASRSTPRTTRSVRA